MKPKLDLTNTTELYNEALKLVPGAVMGVRRPANFVPKEYPVFFKAAMDGIVVDVDDNRYVDLLATYGAIVLGHRYSEIDKAVISHIVEHGVCMNLTQPIQNQLSKKLIEIIPSAERCFMVKTGSDATLAALRIARACTGKNKILRCGYHGWHDWCVEVKGGVPESTYEDIFEFPFNDLDRLESLLKKNDGDVAAVIMWPIDTSLGQEIRFPADRYLEGVRNLCNHYGALLIFDELRTGFRVGLGGAQSEYGVTPDISVIGKAMGNGYSISAVVGRADIMKVLESKVFISSTFFPDAIGQIAALKTIEILECDNVLEKLKIKGVEFEAKVRSILEKGDISCSISGGPWFPYIKFNEKSDMMNMKIRMKFYTSLIRNGVFMSPYHHGYLIARHTSDDLQNVYDAIEEAILDVRS